MKNDTSFKLTYSAKQQEEIQSIRKKYMPLEDNKMEQLRILDAKTGKKAAKYSILLGVIGTLILGIGMSLSMSDFGILIGLGSAAFPLGIAIGVLGMILLACAYPVYNHTLKKEREKIAPEILRLTDELLKK